MIIPHNMREAGYYWVKAFDDWFVASWQYGKWWIPGNEVEENDSYFQEIDERRIIRDVD